MRGLWLFLLYGTLSASVCAPLFDEPNGLGVKDWDVHLFYYAAVVESVVEYGQPPFWNPWYCGGNVLWQNPQVALLSPVYPLATVVSLPLAMKITIVAHYWLGFIGAHLLLVRAIGLGFLPLVVLLATLMTASGALALHLAAGHAPFLAACYYPWLAYCLVRGLQRSDLRYALGAGAAIALMVVNGGFHIVQMAIAAVGIFSLLAAIAVRRWRPLLVAATVAVASLAYSAPKLLPVVYFVTSDRFWDTRPAMPEPDGMTAEMLAHAYLGGDQRPGSIFASQRHAWHEYGNYIGHSLRMQPMVGETVSALRRQAASATGSRPETATSPYSYAARPRPALRSSAVVVERRFSRRTSRRIAWSSSSRLAQRRPGCRSTRT